MELSLIKRIALSKECLPLIIEIWSLYAEPGQESSTRTTELASPGNRCHPKQVTDLTRIPDSSRNMALDADHLKGELSKLAACSAKSKVRNKVMNAIVSYVNKAAQESGNG